MKIDDLAGRRVAIWGFGTEGRATLRALQARLPGQRVAVLNDAPLPPSLREELSLAPEVELQLGSAALAALPSYEVIVKSPGVSPYVGPSAAALEAARAAGSEITSATQIWFDENPAARTLAITGTKGKSTTVALTAHLLRVAGLRVAVGGNIGKAMIDSVASPPQPEPEIWVIELSSYQTASLLARPSIAVLLNLFPEHLDWHGTVAAYYRDKLRLLGRSASGVTPGAVVVNAADPESLRQGDGWVGATRFNDREGIHVRDDQVWDAERPLIASGRLPLLGAHNLSNLCAALSAVRLAGVDPAAIVEAVESFRGLPHRLFALGERGSVLWVDDSISTTPQSAQAAVAAFAGRPVTLLLGGFERGLDYRQLARYAVERPVETVITLPDNGARIAEAVRQARGARSAPKLIEADDLQQAVSLAAASTQAGGVVLLSPAAPSFGRFRDYRERGEEFAKAVGFDP